MNGMYRQKKQPGRVEALNTQKDLLIEQKYKFIASREKLEISRENYQNKLWEDYGLTYANASISQERFCLSGKCARNRRDSRTDS